MINGFVKGGDYQKYDTKIRDHSVEEGSKKSKLMLNMNKENEKVEMIASRITN